MRDNLDAAAPAATIKAGGSADAVPWRRSGAAQLAEGLRAMRARSLAVLDAYAAAGCLQVACSEELNPPLWELGHLGWFQELWVGRNLQRSMGTRYDHAVPRGPSLLAQADSLYDSATVAHATRWHLPLLPVAECKAYLAATLEQTLGLLRAAGPGDDDLYFYRLVLMHEAMHLEAAVYMAQALGVAMDAQLFTDAATPASTAAASVDWAARQIAMPARAWALGQAAAGFVFDNELGPHALQLPGCQMDARPVSWGQYLSYVLKTRCALPRYVRESAQGFEQQRFGQWQVINLDDAAVHLSYREALAYCAHVGRRLPTEAEWECAALTQPEFAWGQVWEWTRSTFAPYPGFVIHPYREYSEPWFLSRPVLRGACVATQACMRSPYYRNFFLPDRNDIFSGFRTCSL